MNLTHVPHSVLSPADLLQWLRYLDRVSPPDQQPVIVIHRHDPRFAWGHLRGCGNRGWPGIPVGQQGDCRLTTEMLDGLHVQVFGDRIEVHLDRADPIKDPIAHAVHDTDLVAGLIVGALAGAALAALGAGRAVALAAPALGAGIGIMTPARRRRRWTLDALIRLAPIAA